MAGLGHLRRFGLREGRRSRMAARLVWRERLFSLARIKGLQNARSRPALPLPGLHAVPRLPGQTASAGSAALQIDDWRSAIYAQATQRKSWNGRGPVTRKS